MYIYVYYLWSQRLAFFTSSLKVPRVEFLRSQHQGSQIFGPRLSLLQARLCCSHGLSWVPLSSSLAWRVCRQDLPTTAACRGELKFARNARFSQIVPPVRPRRDPSSVHVQFRPSRSSPPPDLDVQLCGFVLLEIIVYIFHTSMCIYVLLLYIYMADSF